MQVTNYVVCRMWGRILYRNLNRLTVFSNLDCKKVSLTFAMAKDDRRERHRSLLHFL